MNVEQSESCTQNGKKTLTINLDKVLRIRHFTWTRVNAQVKWNHAIYNFMGFLPPGDISM